MPEDWKQRLHWTPGDQIWNGRWGWTRQRMAAEPQTSPWTLATSNVVIWAGHRDIWDITGPLGGLPSLLHGMARGSSGWLETLDILPFPSS